MSHSKAFSVLHATDFPPGTVEAADADGKWDSNMSRYQYPSLVVGGLMFLKGKSPTLKQIGRALLGVALILVALELMRLTVMPIRDSSFLPYISTSLARDFITAFLADA